MVQIRCLMSCVRCMMPDNIREIKAFAALRYCIDLYNVTLIDKQSHPHGRVRAPRPFYFSSLFSKLRHEKMKLPHDPVRPMCYGHGIMIVIIIIIGPANMYTRVTVV
jgi:hypothetical protein